MLGIEAGKCLKYFQNMDSLNDNKGWRGSTNQRTHFLTGKYKEYEDMFINRKRDIEIHLFHNHYIIVGIKPKGLVIPGI